MVDRVCTLHCHYGVGGVNYALVEYLVEEVFKLQQRVDKLEKGEE